MVECRGDAQQGARRETGRAQQLQLELDAVTQSYQQGRPLGTAWVSLKAMMAKQGLCDATVRNCAT